jgi:hypothetical protein
MEERLPFVEIVDTDNTRIRTFSHDTNEGELKWHQDGEDRWVRALNENDWQIQLDDELPTIISINEYSFIPKYAWHRIIKGSSDLVVEVTFEEPRPE